MSITLASNYLGNMPDELPRGLSDDEVKDSLHVYFAYEGKDIRTVAGGGLKHMGTIEKVFFYVLNFFGILNNTSHVAVQYQMIKLLHVAHSKDILNNELEKTISEAQIKDLLIGVSEAIRGRHIASQLRYSLFKFASLHQDQPGLLTTLFVSSAPKSLYQKETDWGITHLHYASRYTFSCASRVESHILRAISYVDAAELPSDEFCIKFVEILRKQKDAFKETKLDEEDKTKVDLILRKATRALAHRKRYPEAEASIKELRTRLINEKLSISDKAQLILLKYCQGLDCEKDLKEVEEITDAIEDDALDENEKALLRLIFLEDAVSNYDQTKVTKYKLCNWHKTGIETLLLNYPQRTAHLLVQIFHLASHEETLNSHLATYAMCTYAATRGPESKECVMMAEAAYNYAEREYGAEFYHRNNELRWDSETLICMAQALRNDQLFPEAHKIELMTTFLGKPLPQMYDDG